MGETARRRRNPLTDEQIRVREILRTKAKTKEELAAKREIIVARQGMRTVRREALEGIRCKDLAGNPEGRAELYERMTNAAIDGDPVVATALWELFRLRGHMSRAASVYAAVRRLARMMRALRKTEKATTEGKKRIIAAEVSLAPLTRLQALAGDGMRGERERALYAALAEAVEREMERPGRIAAKRRKRARAASTEGQRDELMAAVRKVLASPLDDSPEHVAAVRELGAVVARQKLEVSARRTWSSTVPADCGCPLRYSGQSVMSTPIGSEEERKPDTIVAASIVAQHQRCDDHADVLRPEELLWSIDRGWQLDRASKNLAPIIQAIENEIGVATAPTTVEAKTLMQAGISEELAADQVLDPSALLLDLAMNPSKPPKPPETLDEALGLLLHVYELLEPDARARGSVAFVVRQHASRDGDRPFEVWTDELSNNHELTGGTKLDSGRGETMLAAAVDYIRIVYTAISAAEHEHRAAVDDLEVMACALTGRFPR